jgi:NADH:ubiquinone oxidoreductase subunit K
VPPLDNVLVVNAILFAIGVMGVLTRRNAVLILMSIELMLNAVSLNMVAFAVYGKVDFISKGDPTFTGIIFAFFIIVIAAAEVALALGIVVRTFRNRATANVDEVNLLKW